jgi:hypothetical protein
MSPAFITAIRLGEEKKVIMDLFHRKSQGKDTPTGRDCQFCYRVDPDFTKRDPMDRLVLSKLDDTAAAHLTEDGYVKHRIAELLKKRAVDGMGISLAKSA